MHRSTSVEKYIIIHSDTRSKHWTCIHFLFRTASRLTRCRTSWKPNNQAARCNVTIASINSIIRLLVIHCAQVCIRQRLNRHLNASNVVQMLILLYAVSPIGAVSVALICDLYPVRNCSSVTLITTEMIYHLPDWPRKGAKTQYLVYPKAPPRYPSVYITITNDGKFDA